MQFAHTWEKVLSGEKTQTRRIHRDHYSGSFANGVYQAVYNTLTGYPVWEVGCTYAVQPGRGQKSVGRIRILEIREVNALHISPADVQAEGFANYEEFFTVWQTMHGISEDTWALTFELVKP